MVLNFSVESQCPHIVSELGGTVFSLSPLSIMSSVVFHKCPLSC
jgi:hypothetical protein